MIRTKLPGHDARRILQSQATARANEANLLGLRADQDAIARALNDAAASDAPTFVNGSSSSASSTASTTDTANFQDALSLVWSDLPDGVYDLVVVGSLLAAHSAGGSCNLRVQAGANNGTSYTLSVPNESPATTRLYAVHVFSAVAVSGGLTAKVQYKSSTAGTTSARNPALLVLARRSG